MTSSEILPGEIRPRPVVGRLPRYAAGKPPVAVDGLASYKLSSNENPLPPLPAVLEAIANQQDFNRYPDPLSSKLRAALADFLDVPAEDIVTGAGSLGALNQLLATFAGQNDDGKADEVIYAWRSFEAYPIAVAVTGATSVRVPLTAEARHDLDAMAAAVTERTKAVIVCSPNNPTGPAVRRAELETFLDRMPGHVLVVLDEAYREFVRPAHDSDAFDGIELQRTRPRVVVMRTFAKAYGLAGFRVGYLVAADEVAAAVRACALPFGVSSVAQAAAVASLAREPELFERVEALVAERARVVDALAGQGWAVPEAQGNFVWLPLGERAAEFAAAADEAGVMVRPFAGDGVRVTIGEPAGNDVLLAVAAAFPH
jgi:histidinol-phosphate aminotransferase